MPFSSTPTRCLISAINCSISPSDFKLFASWSLRVAASWEPIAPVLPSKMCSAFWFTLSLIWSTTSTPLAGSVGFTCPALISSIRLLIFARIASLSLVPSAQFETSFLALARASKSEESNAIRSFPIATKPALYSITCFSSRPWGLDCACCKSASLCTCATSWGVPCCATSATCCLAASIFSAFNLPPDGWEPLPVACSNTPCGSTCGFVWGLKSPTPLVIWPIVLPAIDIIIPWVKDASSNLPSWQYIWTKLWTESLVTSNPAASDLARITDTFLAVSGFKFGATLLSNAVCLEINPAPASTNLSPAAVITWLSFVCWSFAVISSALFNTVETALGDLEINRAEFALSPSWISILSAAADVIFNPDWTILSDNWPIFVPVAAKAVSHKTCCVADALFSAVLPVSDVRSSVAWILPSTTAVVAPATVAALPQPAKAPPPVATVVTTMTGARTIPILALLIEDL